MNKKKLLSAILLAAMTLSSMIACSSSDDEDGGGVSYTESEIVELLTGTWYVSGELKMVENESGKRLEGNYTGSIEFKSNQKISRKLSSNCTRNDFPVDNYDDDKLMNMQVNSYISDYYQYIIVT